MTCGRTTRDYKPRCRFPNSTCPAQCCNRDRNTAPFSALHDTLTECATCSTPAPSVHRGTKNAKTFTSTFFPVGDEIEAIVAEWIGELVAQGFEPDDPLFPATKVAPGANRRFAAVGLERKHWRDAGAIRRIFKQAFERVGLPNYNPHVFRHTLAVLGRKSAGHRKSGKPTVRILATPAR
jgi:hypothetical protein